MTERNDVELDECVEQRTELLRQLAELEAAAEWLLAAQDHTIGRLLAAIGPTGDDGFDDDYEHCTSCGDLLDLAGVCGGCGLRQCGQCHAPAKDSAVLCESCGVAWDQAFDAGDGPLVELDAGGA